MRYTSHTFLALAIVSPFAIAAAGQPADLESRRKTLRDLLQEQWEYTMRHYPTFASMLGDKRYNDQLEDYSQQFIDADLEQTRRFLTRFEAINTTGFPDQEVLNQQLMVRDLRMALDGARFKPWEMPVNQISGIQIDLPQLVNILSFETVKDYEDYIARLKQVPRVFDQTTVQMRKGIGDSFMPPRMLLEKAATQANTIGTTSAEKTPFAHPFDKFPDSISEADRKRLREAGLAAIRDSVAPSYLKFATFVRDRASLPKAAPSPESGPFQMVQSAMRSASKRAPPRIFRRKKFIRSGWPR